MASLRTRASRTLAVRVLQKEIRRFLFVAFSASARSPERIVDTAKRPVRILRSTQQLLLR
jgi:hypothetical protein